MTDAVLYQLKDHIVTLTLNKPETRNLVTDSDIPAGPNEACEADRVHSAAAFKDVEASPARFAKCSVRYAAGNGRWISVPLISPKIMKRLSRHSSRSGFQNLWAPEGLRTFVI
jgi:hypothetical protein